MTKTKAGTAICTRTFKPGDGTTYRTGEAITNEAHAAAAMTAGAAAFKPGATASEPKPAVQPEPEPEPETVETPKRRGSKRKASAD